MLDHSTCRSDASRARSRLLRLSLRRELAAYFALSPKAKTASGGCEELVGVLAELARGASRD